MTQTLAQLYQALSQRLQSVTHSKEQASTEADLFLQFILGVNSTQRHADGSAVIPQSEVDKLDELILQRTEKRIPIQYLLHEAWFLGRSFYVNPHVLIPRPETELLVEQVLNMAKPDARILDVGAGPGTIAITLACELKDSATLVAIELSESAFKVAQLNQRKHKTNVDFRLGDLLAPVDANEQFDVIVSNPPYIDPELKDTLTPEVLWHEPEMALFPPNTDACYFYRRLAVEGLPLLNPDGWLMVEVGASMGAEVSAIFEAVGLNEVRTVPDYAGHDRIVLGRR